MTPKLFQVDRNPDERTLRQFGFIALCAFGILAACAYYERGLFAFGLYDARARLAVTTALAALGLGSACASIFYPRANRYTYVGLATLTHPIGVVFSYVILAVLFFGIIAPTGFLLRLAGKDPLQRAFRRDQPSYWTPARPKRSKESYFRQF